MLEHHVFGVLYKVFDDDELARDASLEEACAHVHKSFVKKFGLKREFEGDWWEIVDVKVRKVFQAHLDKTAIISETMPQLFSSLPNHPSWIAEEKFAHHAAKKAGPGATASNTARRRPNPSAGR